MGINSTLTDNAYHHVVLIEFFQVKAVHAVNYFSILVAIVVNVQLVLFIIFDHQGVILLVGYSLVIVQQINGVLVLKVLYKLVVRVQYAQVVQHMTTLLKLVHKHPFFVVTIKYLLLPEVVNVLVDIK
jgi:hypothetical protein